MEFDKIDFVAAVEVLSAIAGVQVPSAQLSLKNEDEKRDEKLKIEGTKNGTKKKKNNVTSKIGGGDDKGNSANNQVSKSNMKNNNIF